MKIGVFDSGIGGLSVARAIERAFPKALVIYINDAKNVPYGTKTEAQIYALARPKIQELYEQNCDVIVLACNTVTMTCQSKLEAAFPVPFIGLEPMVEQAVQQSKTGKIILCATPATIKSARYHQLVRDYAAGATIIEPDCSDWASLIEDNDISEERIHADIEPGLSSGADVIVLACTHYHWIEQSIAAIAGNRAVILQPENDVIQQIARL